METEIFTPKRANDYFAPRKRFRPAEMLFDEFWREGELALMFGAAGSGKSMFAVQLADALARGSGLHGFRMQSGGRRVLYVDLRNTDEQFKARCSWRSEGRARNGRQRHVFPKNLFRDAPKSGQDLCEWIRNYVAEARTRIVIIDDLAAIKKTHDGTRETLALMRELRALRDDLGISILVVTDALAKKGNFVGENDMGRSRVLCTVADSVFAIGRDMYRIGDRYLLQTRSKAASIYWTEKNAPRALLVRMPSGLLAFDFDERFSEAMPEEKRRLIYEVNKLHIDDGKTFREIAAELGISRSWAYKLYQKWTPSLERTMQDAEGKMSEPGATATDSSDEVDEYEDEYWDETEISAEASEWLSEEFKMQNAECRIEGENRSDDGEAIHHSSFSILNLAKIPFAAGLGRRSVYELDIGWDSCGNEIYVESRNERTRKPLVWYQIDRKGTTRRFKRGTFGIQVERLNTGPFL